MLVNASAVGYYGDTGDRVVDETAPPGTGFLAQLCRGLGGGHRAGRRRRRAGGAGPHRPGAVAASGGMLGRLRPLFSLGLGARLGNGRQYMSWISLEDQVRALLFAITHDELSGPVNFTGPAPVTNAEFTAALGRTVNRPTPLMVPGFALRAVARRVRRRGRCSAGSARSPPRWSGPVSSSTTTPIGEALALRHRAGDR